MILFQWLLWVPGPETHSSVSCMIKSNGAYLWPRSLSVRDRSIIILSSMDDGSSWPSLVGRWSNISVSPTFVFCSYHGEHFPYILFFILLTFIFFVLLYITHHCSVSGLGYWPPSHHAPFLHCLSLCTQLLLCLFLFSLPSFCRLEVWVYLKLYIQTPSALACLTSILCVELSFHLLPEPFPVFNSHLVQFNIVVVLSVIFVDI